MNIKTEQLRIILTNVEKLRKMSQPYNSDSKAQVLCQVALVYT